MPEEVLAFCLYDPRAQRMLDGKNTNLTFEPASLVKMMTEYVTLLAIREKKVSLDAAVKISNKAWKTGGSRMWIEPRYPVKIKDLLTGLVVASGNDAAVALAEAVAGSEEKFVVLMNETAKKLGLAHTHFANASGLPHPENRSTCEDLTRLSARLIEDFPDFYPVHKEKYFTYNKIRQNNRNLLLWRDESVDGVKTGHIEAVGYHIVASAARGQRRLIAVAAGAKNEETRARAALALLNHGFEDFEVHKIYEAKKEVARVPVWKGAVEEVPVGVKEDLWVTLPKGAYEKLSAHLETQKPLTAPLHEGQQVGTMVLEAEKEKLLEVPMVALEEVEKAGFWARLWDALRLLVEKS